MKNDGSRPASPLLHAGAVAGLISSLGMLFFCRGGEEACVLEDG